MKPLDWIILSFLLVFLLIAGCASIHWRQKHPLPPSWDNQKFLLIVPHILWGDKIIPSWEPLPQTHRCIYNGLYQFSSVTQSCPTVTPWTRQASLSITNSRSTPKPMSIEWVMPSNHLILCRPLFLLPSIFPSIRVFSNELVLHIRWPKYWSFSFNISPFNEHPGLISFRMDWLDLLAVQGTLSRVQHQHHSSKASILRHSAFFIV